MTPKKTDYTWLNKDSRLVLSRGYLEKGDTPEQRIEQIAATAEKILKIKGFGDKFVSYMKKGWFSLSSPIWSNFGNNRGLPISCSNSHVSDTMGEILTKVSEVGMMTKYGAGTSGFFGDIRPRGADIKTGGSASGPVHFMQLFDTITDVVSQSSVRRGNFAAYLPVEHPDIEEFLEIREEGNPIQHIFIGVCISDEWMESMIAGDKKKRKVMARIIKKRFEKGFPYIFFTDNVNRGAADVYRDKNMRVNGSNLCVTGDQRIPSQHGLLTAKELAQIGGDLVLFDNKEQVDASPMQLIQTNAPVFTITLENGLTHTVTDYHKVLRINDDGTTETVPTAELQVGDKVAIQTKNSGLFGSLSLEKEAYHAGNHRLPPPDKLWEATEASIREYIRGALSSNPTLPVYSERLDYIRTLQLLCANVGIAKKITASPWYDNEPLRLTYALETVPASEDTAFSKVVSVTPSGNEDVYCCTVKSDSHLFVCNGVVTHNCSEITLPSTTDESFICNLSSMNLLHYDEWKDTDAVETLTFFLDAVMSEYITKTKTIPYMDAAHRFAKRHRAIGIGTLGYHSLLQSKMFPFESWDARALNVEAHRLISEQALEASKKLARMFGEPEVLKGYGRRNTTLMAIAPTTSSSFILGQVSLGIEPLDDNYHTKKIAKGSFIYRNPKLAEVLEAHGKNTEAVWSKILKYGGSVQTLNFLTDHEKAVFKTFGEISPAEIVLQAAARQKFIDQSQSLNLKIHPQTKSKEVLNLVIEGWRAGIKTFYYQHGVNAAQEFNRDLINCSACEG